MSEDSKKKVREYWVVHDADLKGNCGHSIVAFGPTPIGFSVYGFKAVHPNDDNMENDFDAWARKFTEGEEGELKLEKCQIIDDW